MDQITELRQINLKILTDDDVATAASRLVQSALPLVSWIVENARKDRWKSHRDASDAPYTTFYKWATDSLPKGGGLMREGVEPDLMGQFLPLTFENAVDLCEYFDLCDLRLMMWLKHERHFGRMNTPSWPNPDLDPDVWPPRAAFEPKSESGDA